MREFRGEKSYECKDVGKLSHGCLSSPNMREITQERNPMNAKSIGKHSYRTLTSIIIKEFLRDRKRLMVKNLRKLLKVKPQNIKPAETDYIFTRTNSFLGQEAILHLFSYLSHMHFLSLYSYMA